jgi:hypothetical protein
MLGELNFWQVLLKDGGNWLMGCWLGPWPKARPSMTLNFSLNTQSGSGFIPKNYQYSCANLLKWVHQEMYKNLFITFTCLYKPQKWEIMQAENPGQYFCKSFLKICFSKNRASPGISNVSWESLEMIHDTPIWIILPFVSCCCCCQWQWLGLSNSDYIISVA